MILDFLTRLALTAFCASISLRSAAASVVTIVDDDTQSVEAVAGVREVAESLGVKVTFAAIARNVERSPDLAAYLVDCQSAGHEIASHSYSHSPRIWSRSDPREGYLAEMERDVERAHSVLTNAGLRVSSFVYPYGNFRGRDYRTSVIEMIGRRYPLAFNSRGGDNRSGETHFLYVGRHPLRSHDSSIMTKRFLRSAAEKGDCWIVILTHGGKSDFVSDDLRSVITTCQDAGCVFATASEAMRILTARGWTSIPADATLEVSFAEELLSLVEFHLPCFAAAACLFALFAIVCIRIIIKSTRKRRIGI